ncbi:kinase-like domain-containing protein [Penicillium longicatenatum]|uniref:kinase-like domain-containing protein n=1 Tax=Penicillium longicatenatum TaxID=1561947 RepID=UPI002546D7A4|nr:kinase-like domain-containing protein [Penicillium longicatenatum]KAJ5650467.1 kinase-like domain-containing protein [Penicillium longicatenatum]
MDYLDLDLEDTRLNTTFPAPGEIRHISYHSDPDIGKRMIEDEEIWHTKDNLGEGGFGTVWLQERISHNGSKKPSFRAVKMLDKSGKSTNMYKKELMAMAKFSKPLYRRCFIECYGWYLQEENVCIAMEYARHQDLQKHLTRSFPESEAGLIASQLAEGLRFMHDNKYAHRDLKPANIMVMYPGPDWWVKIGDFGISKRAVEGVTSLHTKVFTPDYAAPELRGLGVSRAVNNGKKDEVAYTFAIDMWSFGEICVRLLTKTAAFPELMQLVDYKLYGIFLPDDALFRNGLGSDCRSFIRKAMDMNPENRFTAEEAQGHPWITKFKKAPYSQDVRSPTPPSSEIVPMNNAAEEITVQARPQSQGTAVWDTVESLQATVISRDKIETSQAPKERTHVIVDKNTLTDETDEFLRAFGDVQSAWSIGAENLNQSEHSDKGSGGSKPRIIEAFEEKDRKARTGNIINRRSTPDGKLAQSQNIEPGDYLFVLYDFAARSSDELTIMRGQIILLIETDQIYKDEWWKGEEVRTKERGIFPARYTRKAQEDEKELYKISINTPLKLDPSVFTLAHKEPSQPGKSLLSAERPISTGSSSAGNDRYVKPKSDKEVQPLPFVKNSQSRTKKIFGFFR